MVLIIFFAAYLRGRSADRRLSHEKQHQKPNLKTENNSKHYKTLKKRSKNDYAVFENFHFNLKNGPHGTFVF